MITIMELNKALGIEKPTPQSEPTPQSDPEPNEGGEE